MKKCFVLLMTMVLTLTGCWSFSVSADSSASEVTVEDTENTSDTLVIYFSRTGEQYVVGEIDKGNTAIVAEMIAEQTGGELFEVLPADDNTR